MERKVIRLNCKVSAWTVLRRVRMSSTRERYRGYEEPGTEQLMRQKLDKRSYG